MNSSTPLTATRREARRNNRREAILDVAARSFFEQGYAGTTMSAIAATLGGSKGTLWSYFASKDVLFAAVIDSRTEAFRAQLSLILNPHDEVSSALRRFCTEFVRKVASPDAIALYRLALGESKRFPAVGEIFYERGPKATQRLLANYIAEAMGRGALRRADPESAAQQFVALCLSGCHQRLILGVMRSVDAEALAREAERAADTFIRAYAPDKG